MKRQQIIRRIIGHPHYVVSSCGHIYKIKKLNIKKSGYLQVALHNSKKSKHYRVHRLVARAFLGKPKSNKDQVNHLDGNKTNNDISNLNWVTSKENCLHALEAGLYKRRLKLTTRRVAEVKRLLRLKEKQVDIAKKYNVSQHIISRIKRGTYFLGGLKGKVR